MPAKTVLNTRPTSQSAQTCEVFKELGFEVINFPCIEIVKSDDVEKCQKQISEINSKSIIIFTSQQAVIYAFKIKPDWQISQNSIVIAVGTKTAEYLEQHIKNNIFVPEQQNSQGVIDILKGLKDIPTISLISAENGRHEIQNHANDKNIKLNQINVYQRQIPTITKPINWINNSLEASVLATSISIIENLELMVEKKDWLILQNQLFLCASTRIENYAHKIGIKHTLYTSSANSKVMAQKLSDYLLVK